MMRYKYLRLRGKYEEKTDLVVPLTFLFTPARKETKEEIGITDREGTLYSTSNCTSAYYSGTFSTVLPKLKCSL